MEQPIPYRFPVNSSPAALLWGLPEQPFGLSSISESVVASLAHLLEGDQGLLLDSDIPDLSRLLERFLETLAHHLKALQHVFLVRHWKAQNLLIPDNKFDEYK